MLAAANRHQAVVGTGRTEYAVTAPDWRPRTGASSSRPLPAVHVAAFARCATFTHTLSNGR
jgi:hypothetical protein